MHNHLFDGLKVIDCATVIAAPAAAMMLADFGADVIKVEQPGSGDMLRILSDIPTTPDAPGDWFWQLDGRNKRSITLNLKTPEGVQLLHELISSADVFITNHPYPLREQLGITFEQVQQLRPDIIYASLTAYGELGDERDRKGFDQLAYWARSGLMELMREPDTLPTQGLPGMGDHPTAVALYAGIVTALLHRAQTGEGGKVETSLLANGLWSAAGIAQGVLAGGDMKEFRARNRVYPTMFRPYQTADNRWLQLNMVRDEEQFALTFAALDALHLLSDPRFADPDAMWTNRAALSEEIQDLIARQPAKVWLALFEEFNIPVNLVTNIEEVAEDPQIFANHMAVDTRDADMNCPWIINHPVKISSVPQVGPQRAPELGEHSEAILREMGYKDAEIQVLRDKEIF